MQRAALWTILAFTLTAGVPTLPVLGPATAHARGDHGRHRAHDRQHRPRHFDWDKHRDRRLDRFAPADTSRDVYFFRYVSDPTVAPMPPNPDSCAGAPFEGNASFEGPLTTFRVSPRTGKLRPSWFTAREAGYAKACVQLMDFTFEPFGSPVPIYWEITLDHVGTFKASGYCFPSNNTVPEEGIILGGCTTTLTEVPEDYLGGNMVESGVLLNPFGHPDYELSSSFFTFHLFPR